jgi:hypothetical protein
MKGISGGVFEVAPAEFLFQQGKKKEKPLGCGVALGQSERLTGAQIIKDRNIRIY